MIYVLFCQIGIDMFRYVVVPAQIMMHVWARMFAKNSVFYVIVIVAARKTDKLSLQW